MTATAEDARAALRSTWLRFGREQCQGYSPLYASISDAVAGDDAVLDLVLTAPPPGRQPNVLLAAAHDLVLRGTPHPLAAIYGGGGGEGDAGAAFCDLVLTHRDEISQLLAVRRTNTNECGRSAVLVPALRWTVARVGEPIVLLDAGTSAGVNLHLDRYLLDYGARGTTGPADAAVRIECDVVGGALIAPRAPDIAARIGLDRAPVDLRSDDELRWLLACVWPDTGRMARTRAALALTRDDPPEIVRGDLVDDLQATANRLPRDLPLCVTTTWVLAYLPRPRHADFVGHLRSLARRRPVAWISAEGPGVVASLPDAPAAERVGIEPSVLAVSLFDGDREDVQVLGRCHPHGSWLEWTAPGG